MEALALDRGGNLMGNKVSMRDKIAQLAFQEMGQGGGYLDSYDAADEIMAALPSMVVPLVWEPQSFLIGATRSAEKATEHDGFIADTVVGGAYKAVNGRWWHSEKGCGSSSSLGEAKAAAEAHHVAQIMAAFGINA